MTSISSKRTFRLALRCLAFTLVAEATAQNVQDGDSLIRGDGVRLYGIDAPEKD